MSLLLSETSIRSLRLRNRVVLAPLVTHAADRGHIGDWHLMHLGKFAAGGVGLVMTESTKIHPSGCGTLRDMGLWADAFIPGLRRVADFVHSQGAAIGIQLSHAGRKARNSLPWEGRGPLSLEQAGPVDWDWTLVGPSAVAHNATYDVPRELSIAEIATLVEAWGEAARRADQAGFDVVEIHAAHGYLLHQFLSTAANRRTDRYGGSLANRMRFTLEVAEHVRTCWPAEKPLFVRISAIDEQGWSIEESVTLCRALKTCGVDVIDCSTGGIGEGMMTLGQTDRVLGYGYQVPHAARIRKSADIATMAVGLIIHPDHAESILAEGQADLIALGRELMFNPHWTLDAASKLGVSTIWSQIPPSYGFWLEKRPLTAIGAIPSTWRPAQ